MKLTIDSLIHSEIYYKVTVEICKNISTRLNSPNISLDCIFNNNLHEQQSPDLNLDSIH